MLMLGIMYMASLSDPANSLLDTMSSELMGSILLGRRLITSIPLASTSLVSQGAMEESCCEVVVDVGATPVPQAPIIGAREEMVRIAGTKLSFPYC